jgi:glycosyltransferase involved in cell wall biosynthesis
MEKMKSILKKFGVADCVSIEPQYEDINELIDSCTMGIQPSTVESFGGVALNFLLKGKPVVATDIGGFQDFVPKEFLVPTSAPEKLSAKPIFRTLLGSNKVESGHYSSPPALRDVSVLRILEVERCIPSEKSGGGNNCFRRCGWWCA